VLLGGIGKILLLWQWHTYLKMAGDIEYI